MGYLISGRLGDGAWMGWESSSAAAAIVAVAIAIARLGGCRADAFPINWGATAPN